jgi:hypothetical protein
VLILSITPAIGRDIKASHCHRMQYPSIALPAIRRNIKASRRHPAQYPSVALLAIGRKIKASRRLIDVAGKPASRLF